MLAPRASMPALSAAITPSRSALVLLARQPPRRAARVHARPEQRLVRVDVADARDPALVQQERLDRRRPALREARAGAAPVKPSSNGSRPSRSAKNASSASVPSSSSPVPKRRGSTIASTLRRAGRVRLSSHAHAHVRRLGVRLCEHRAGHAQVLREVHVAVEAPHQVLAAPSQALDAPARAAPARARAARADATSAGRGSRSRVSLRPSTSGASWRLIVSTSGSSGIRPSL